MYYLWILHYSLIKGVYTKRWKGMTNSVDGLAFCCLLLLSLFVFVLCVDKELLWDLIRKRLPLGPIVKGILVLLAPVLLFLLSGRLTKQKIRITRKVIQVKSKVGRVFSVIYLSVFICMFVLTLLIVALSRTPF